MRLRQPCDPVACVQIQQLHARAQGLEERALAAESLSATRADGLEQLGLELKRAQAEAASHATGRDQVRPLTERLFVPELWGVMSGLTHEPHWHIPFASHTLTVYTSSCLQDDQQLRVQLDTERRRAASLLEALEATRGELQERDATMRSAERARQAQVTQLQDRLAGMDSRLLESEHRLRETLASAERAQAVRAPPCPFV